VVSVVARDPRSCGFDAWPRAPGSSCGLAVYNHLSSEAPRFEQQTATISAT